MDDWKKSSEILRSTAKWISPEQAEAERKRKAATKGKMWLVFIGSGIASGILAAIYGNAQLFWYGWIVMGMIGAGMVMD